ncbi:ABC transporter substrate-binding protein [uncultured Sanguibacteroides sp.]|uniref:ABC transporter substrate-binding protein n=1 Tax=uncultured Sanguibacteroides sp. TaxID=1635151 RepID=UPI0025FE0FF6|nr:ABC transporter substrate-binding protein [uncultured Sanguibacteroides sp.]
MNKFICFFCFCLLASCGGISKEGKGHFRSFTDALQREVKVPDTVRRIVCIRASAIRLVTYAGGVPFICGVEEQETRDNEFTHLFAHPELRGKAIIGPSMGGDSELIMGVEPDVIFMSTTTVGDADALQKRTGIPVFTIEYGDMGKKRDVFYHSLRLIGEVLRTEKQVDSLICFVDRQIEELRQRTKEVDKSKRVYVGAISYKGQKGITSTDPYYAAFDFLGVYNVASQIDSAYVSPITGTYIDWEQLADWDPEVIFLDVSGWPLVQEDFNSRKGINHLLTAYRNRQIYMLWPYNNSHTNFEVMLINAWYVGKVLFPDQFEDISITDKSNEILIRFVGQPVDTVLRRYWGDYKNVFEGE